VNELMSKNTHVGTQPKCVVMKFSGTSVADAAAIRRVSQLVKRRLRHRPVVIVSALAKVTDQLLNAGNVAAQGGLQITREAIQQLRQRHQLVAQELVEPGRYACLWTELERGFGQLNGQLEDIAASGVFREAAQDRLLGMGEWFSSKILHAALLRTGLDVAWVDAAACIVTDAVHTRAMPLWQETNHRMEAQILPLLHIGQIPILGGFVGTTPDGVPTTLGRGGSNFSAAIVGAALQASRIEIWTDVDGVMTTDPALCPDARRVTSLSFGEAAELAYFGLQMLHPAMLAPAMRCNIPVWVLNSRNQERGGTEITAKVSDGGRVKAIAAKRGVTVVDVEPLNWFGRELSRQIFNVFERHQHGLELLTASHGSVSVVVSSAADLPAIARELEGSAHVRWEKQKALVCLVGETIRRRPEIASQALHAISDIDLRMIGQGASDRSVSFLVDDSRAEEAVRRLHQLLFPAPMPPESNLSPMMAQSQPLAGTC
jgi:aspartate kinase